MKSAYVSIRWIKIFFIICSLTYLDPVWIRGVFISGRKFIKDESNTDDREVGENEDERDEVIIDPPDKFSHIMG